STSLVVLLAGPALLGVMESFVITGALSWGLARAGTQHHLQQSRSAIPKSVKPAWIAENFDIFDFELSSGELTAIGRARHRRARRPSTRDNHARAIRPADPRGMSRIFITGSTDGLGRAAARALIDEGHHVVLHARSRERAAAVGDLAARSAGVVVGDLSSAAETRSVAEQVNAIGRMDAVIHNAGTYSTSGRSPTPEGHAAILAVNTLAPYMLTALIERPNRLIYLSSGMHRGGVGSLRDIDWTERRWNSSQAYSDSKLYVTALAFAVARCWPDVLSNAVDPGWVPTKMGGRGAPDDFDEGYLTQTWLAVSDDPAATVSGHYWHHRRRQTAAREASDPRFQDQLSARLAELTGVQLF
ncbi:MAG TPA: SDR family NAD(P)-dependent oxidoreductase, partial [Gemmatimonadales bacterium]|nr:SDR family NAD(P)-dependent oxidoreductase [Gemmatimonadales bacterium]